MNGRGFVLSPSGDELGSRLGFARLQTSFQSSQKEVGKVLDKAQSICDTDTVNGEHEHRERRSDTKNTSASPRVCRVAVQQAKEERTRAP